VAALGIGVLVARGGPRSAAPAREANGGGAGSAPAVPPIPQAERPTADGATVRVDAQPAGLGAREVTAVVNEAALMVRLHQLGETNPPLSLQLARDGNARYPKSADAPERAFIVVKSLVDMGRFKKAQAEARKMLKSYPNDPHTLDVERHLLSNPLE
jgi:hypothetical protein